MLTSFRAWLVFLGLTVLTGYVSWMYAPAPPEPKSLRTVAEPWVLYQEPKAQAEKAQAILIKKSLWGKLPDAEAPASLNDPEWRFLGIVTNGPERFVLIKVDGQPEQRLTINDRLPGGGKIMKIENDKLCLLINGKRRSLGIYRMGPQAL